MEVDIAIHQRLEECVKASAFLTKAQQGQEPIQMRQLRVKEVCSSWIHMETHGFTMNV